MTVPILLARLVMLAKRVPVVNSTLSWFARRYSEGSIVNICFGFARGMKWRRHHRYISAYWLGHYELHLQSVLVHELHPGAIFFDVGANAGFFTLIAARRIGPSGRCIAFDPDVDNIASIRDLCALNTLTWVMPINVAIADTVGTNWFTRPYPGAATGHLSDVGDEESLQVPTMTLDVAAAKYGTPDVIKMDIEGAEGKAMIGARNLLSARRTVWLIEIHGSTSEEEVRAAFSGLGYGLSSIGQRSSPSDQIFPRHIIAHPD